MFAFGRLVCGNGFPCQRPTVYPQVIILSINGLATDPEGGRMFIDKNLG